MKFYIISPLTPCGDIVHLITAPSGQCCGGQAVTVRTARNPPGALRHPGGAPGAAPVSQGSRAVHLAGSGTALYRGTGGSVPGASRALGLGEVRHKQALFGLMFWQ